MKTHKYEEFATPVLSMMFTLQVVQLLLSLVIGSLSTEHTAASLAQENVDSAWRSRLEAYPGRGFFVALAYFAGDGILHVRHPSSTEFTYCSLAIKAFTRH